MSDSSELIALLEPMAFPSWWEVLQSRLTDSGKHWAHCDKLHEQSRSSRENGDVAAAEQFSEMAADAQKRIEYSHQLLDEHAAKLGQAKRLAEQLGVRTASRLPLNDINVWKSCDPVKSAENIAELLDDVRATKADSGNRDLLHNLWTAVYCGVKAYNERRPVEIEMWVQEFRDVHRLFSNNDWTMLPNESSLLAAVGELWEAVDGLERTVKLRNRPTEVLMPTEAIDVVKRAEHAMRQFESQRKPDASPTATNPKRSTERGEARLKLIGALTKHHKYATGGCLNLEPIGVNELARQAGVVKSTASAFFTKEFKGHDKYRAKCGDATTLVAALKMLNQEFAPHDLFGATPPGERDRDEDE